MFRLLQPGTPEDIQSVKDTQVATAVLSGDIPLKYLSTSGYTYSVLENAIARNAVHTGALRKMNRLACVQRRK